LLLVPDWTADHVHRGANGGGRDIHRCTNDGTGHRCGGGDDGTGWEQRDWHQKAKYPYVAHVAYPLEDWENCYLNVYIPIGAFMPNIVRNFYLESLMRK
jgi:hypothetical protein